MIKLIGTLLGIVLSIPLLITLFIVFLILGKEGGFIVHYMMDAKLSGTNGHVKAEQGKFRFIRNGAFHRVI